MPYEIKVGVIGWIDAAGPWPFSAGDGGGATAGQMVAGLQDNSSGVVRTYMGLMATSNSAPPSTLNFPSYRETRNFRAMVWAHLLYEDAAPGAAAAAGVTYVGSESASKIVDAGYTPPVDTTKVAAMGYLPPWMTEERQHVSDRTWYAAEASPLSDICLGARHPNSVLRNEGQGEAVIANGLLRFRAGPHTDAVGISDANAQYHVPWVWAEFLLTTQGKGKVRCRGASSQFPTVAWYVNDVRVGQPHAQTTDSRFHFNFLNMIEVASLRIWPVLQAGAPRAMDEPSLASDSKFKGQIKRVTTLPYTCPGGAYVNETAASALVAGAFVLRK